MDINDKILGLATFIQDLVESGEGYSRPYQYWDSRDDLRYLGLGIKPSMLKKLPDFEGDPENAYFGNEEFKKWNGWKIGRKDEMPEGFVWNCFADLCDEDGDGYPSIGVQDEYIKSLYDKYCDSEEDADERASRILQDWMADSEEDADDEDSNTVQVVLKGFGIAYDLYPSLEALRMSREEAKEQGIKLLEYKGRLYAQDEDNDIPIILLRSVSAVEVNGEDIYEETGVERYSDSILPEDSLEVGKYAVAKGKEMDDIVGHFNIELEKGEKFSPAKLQLVITGQEFPSEDYLKSPYQIIYDGRVVLVESLTRPLTQRAYPQFVYTVEAKEPEVALKDVVLTDIGGKKLLLAKRLCDVTGLELGDVNKMLNSVPCAVLTGMSDEEAEFAKEQIEGAGATVELRPSGKADTAKVVPVEDGPDVPEDGIMPTMDDETMWICGNGMLTHEIKQNSILWKSFVEFHGRIVTRIVFKGNVTDIFGSTFSREFKFSDFPNLREVVMCNGVSELPMNAFRGCENLEKITLPDSLRKIDLTAFRGCDNLAEVVNLHSRIDYGRAFNQTPKLKDVIPAQHK